MVTNKRKRTRTFLATALWAVGITMIGSSARAGLIDLNPTGGSTSPIVSIAGIDLAPGNALAQGSLPLTVGKTFQLEYQSSVSGFIDSRGITMSPSGLNTSYQITAVASFTEVVQSVNGASATFALAANQSPNSFFELYYNPAVVANSLAGTGFNQGTLILAGKPATELANVGIFSLSTNSSGQPLTQGFDQFLTNHYPGVQSVAGSGSSLISTDVTFENTDFFKSSVSEISFNSSLVSSFAQTSPSAQFLSHSGAGSPDITPDIGSVNGFNGKDFQFQADANFAFNSIPPASVPEPLSVIHWGLGGLGVMGLRVWLKKLEKNRRASAF